MSQTTGDGVAMGRHSDEPAEAKQEWHAPRLMVIGDADTVTAANTLVNPTDATTILAEFS